MVLGQTYSDRDSAFEVIVDSIPVYEVEKWLPNGESRVMLEELIQTIMPSGLDYQIRIVTEKGDVRLGAKEKQSFLGLSSRLSSV